MGKTKVLIDPFVSLLDVFVKKNWVTYPNYLEIIKRFGELFEVLQKEETDLIIELTNRYSWFSYKEYMEGSVNLLKHFLENLDKGIERLVFFPLMDEDKEEDIKSGTAFMYDLKSARSFLGDTEHQYKYLDSFEKLKRFKFKQGDYLILVDDYIGSGDTYFKTVEKIEELKIKTPNYSVLALVAQHEAVERLKSKKVENVIFKTFKKGISDYYKGEELEKNIQLMRKIEKNIPNVKRYTLGFGQCEGLITLLRTPNNTFPIFWKRFSKKDGKEYLAPFSRY